MKTELKYEFDHDEQEDFRIITQARSFASMLHEYDQWLRSQIKYAPDMQPEQVTNTYQAARDKLWEIANQEGVDL